MIRICIQVAELASLAQLLPPCSPTCVIRRRTALRQGVRFSCCSPIALIRFNCCSPFASASAAARHLCLLQLLLPDCVRFNCSPIASALAVAPRLQVQLLLRLHTCSSPIACASAAAPPLRPLRLLLPDCIRLTLVASPVLEDSSPCLMFSNVLRGVREVQ